MRIYNKY